MKLVVIYGPPAAGKLTVATELARMTGFKLFHNHLANDLVHSLFPYGSPPFVKYVERFRIELLEAAARERIPGVIFTFVYAHKEDDAVMRRWLRRLKKYRVRVVGVNLACHPRELCRRVGHPSRRSYGKIKSVTLLKSVMNRHALGKAIPFVETLEIDNTSLSPKSCARRIKAHYGL